MPNIAGSIDLCLLRYLPPPPKAQSDPPLPKNQYSTPSKLTPLYDSPPVPLRPGKMTPLGPQRVRAQHLPGTPPPLGSLLSTHKHCKSPPPPHFTHRLCLCFQVE
jgi:hypothetical protein